MIIRKQLDVLMSRLNEKRRFIQVIAGPRQVGKTTLISQLVNRLAMPVTSLSADNVDKTNIEWIADQWRAVRIQMSAQKQPEHILIIDEIHKIDQWSEVVKREWDADTLSQTNIKVVLLGSSRLLLKDGLTESLAGRFEIIRMPHWSLKEMQEAFSVSPDQFIYFGGYPGAASLISDERRWRKYVMDSIVRPAIDKDVLMTKRILKPALLRQAFAIGCAYSSELLSYNKMLGQLQDAGNTSTLANYLNTLGEAHLLAGLQKYAIDTARKYQSINKLQVFNNAFLTVHQGRGFMTEYADRKRWGRWVESAVGAHLMNYAEDYDYRVYYWRDEQSNEVDFIVVGQHQMMAIEVKSGHRTDNAGLHLFTEKFHPNLSLVVGAEGMPVDLFLATDIMQFGF